MLPMFRQFTHITSDKERETVHFSTHISPIISPTILPMVEKKMAGDCNLLSVSICQGFLQVCTLYEAMMCNTAHMPNTRAAWQSFNTGISNMLALVIFKFNNKITNTFECFALSPIQSGISVQHHRLKVN